MFQAQRGGFFPQGENLWVERGEHTRQDPEAQDQGAEDTTSRARRPDPRETCIRFIYW